MHDRILLPTDGSEEMATVAEYAFDLAALTDAEVHLLYVVDETAFSSVPVEVQEQVQEALAGDGESATSALGKRAYERGLTAVQEVRSGNPAVTIVAYAVENDVDLVVMGTHGRTGFDYYLLGSVAERVVQTSPVPVTTVPIGERTDTTAFE